MKSILFTILFCGLIFSLAEKTPGQRQPPAPLIYEVPSNSSLKQFVSEEQGFEAVFPGEPSATNNATTEFKVASFQTYLKGSHSRVSVYEYGEIIDKDKSALYAVIRGNLLKQPNTTLESEKDLKNGEVDGKEFNVLSDYQYQRIRVFARGKKLYMVSCDVTNWHILSDYYKEKVAAFKTESERFMNSFKINK